MTTRRLSPTAELCISLTNETEGYTFSDWTESLIDSWLAEKVYADDAEYVTDDDVIGLDVDMGELYRELVKEYGRCTSSVYVDQLNGPPVRIGWFFVSRQRYEDTGKMYLRGAWVTLRGKVQEMTPAVYERVGI